MGNTNLCSTEKLCGSFPKLTETNQQYILGLAEGLKKAQNGRSKEQQKQDKTVQPSTAQAN